MISTIFEWSMNLIETFMLIEFVARYLGSRYDDNRKKVGFLCAWMTAFIELCIINHFVVLESIGAYIPTFIYFTYSLICLKGTVLLKLWVSVLAQILVTVIAIGTNLLVCNIIGYDPVSMITVFNSTRIISVIITKVILFYVTRLILRNRYKNPLDAQNWFVLIIIPLISMISVSSLMLAAMNNEEIKTYMLVGMSGILTANIITYYLFTKLNKDYENKLRIQLLEQQKENAEKSIKDIDAFVKQMRTVKHDIKNQLIIITNYIQTNKTDVAIDHINRIIDGYLPNINSYINTGNDAFDAIANSKSAICSQKNIYITYNLMDNSLVGLDAIDTGVLFGNLLDNAIEAAEKTVKKIITVDIKRQGSYLAVKVCNSIDKSVLRDNKELKTTKNEKLCHGVGIKSIKSVVEKYDGMIRFYEENNEFCCYIMLNV